MKSWIYMSLKIIYTSEQRGGQMLSECTTPSNERFSQFSVICILCVLCRRTEFHFVNAWAKNPASEVIAQNQIG